MARETGYYWVRFTDQSPWSIAYWAYGMWTIGHKIVEPVEIDERRIVRGESKRAVSKREKAKRNLHITSVVLKGDRMMDVAKLHGLTSPRVRQIVHRTLERRNPELFKKLAEYRPGQQTPSIGDLAAHAAEFGFAVGNTEATQ